MIPGPVSVKSPAWFVCPRASTDAERRLFFFPYAGGSPAAFGKWLPALPGHIEGWAAHLPGRGSRRLETPYRSLSAVIEDLGRAIRPLLDRPYAFFGHSLGALAAFELTRQLRRYDLPQPQTLFVSGCQAPQLPRSQRAVHALPDTEFLEALKAFNGIPDEVLRQPEVIELLLPVLRADFEAFETYAYAHEPPLDCRIAAFMGDADPRVRPENAEAWASQTNSSFKSEYFHGDHFFINANREAIIAEMERSWSDDTP